MIDINCIERTSEAGTPKGIQSTRARLPITGAVTIPTQEVTLRGPQDFVKQQHVYNRNLKSSPEQKVFFALASAKIWFSKIAMHFPISERDRIFKQLDVLHNFEDWDDLDHPISVESFKTFVRAIIIYKINAKPSISLMPDGNLLARWLDTNDKMVIEFLPENHVRWMIEDKNFPEDETASGKAALNRLKQVIAPYHSSRWLNGS